MPLAVSLLKNPKVEIAIGTPLDWGIEAAKVFGGERHAYRPQEPGDQAADDEDDGQCRCPPDDQSARSSIKARR